MPEYISREAVLAQKGDCYDKDGHLLYAVGTGNILRIPAADVVERPRWVSVTERLPDAYEEVILQFPNNQAAGFCDRDGCWGVYSGDGFYTEVADNEPKPTHWAKKLPEPPKEEE